MSQHQDAMSTECRVTLHRIKEMETHVYRKCQKNLGNLRFIFATNNFNKTWEKFGAKKIWREKPVLNQIPPVPFENQFQLDFGKTQNYNYITITSHKQSDGLTNTTLSAVSFPS